MPDPSRSAALAAIARRLGLAALLMAGVTVGSAAGEPPKKDKPAATAAAPKVATAKPPAKAPRPATPASEPVPKFTNDDLPKVSAERDRDAADEDDAEVEPADGASSPTGGKPKPKAGGQEADAEDEGKDFESVLGEEERAAKTVLLQRQIADAEKRIEQLQSRRRALQNALHAGLVPAGPDEQEAVGGQGNDVRLAWVEEQIAATRKAMARDREELARIQAH